MRKADIEKVRLINYHFLKFIKDSYNEGCRVFIDHEEMTDERDSYEIYLDEDEYGTKHNYGRTVWWNKESEDERTVSETKKLNLDTDMLVMKPFDKERNLYEVYTSKGIMKIVEDIIKKGKGE